ncbi:MAG TPA: hypothetical protein PKB01_09835 [Xanthobacteraceae bacterium]|nr:hypothetical protein [Xanthobacteraceae bacterium]
MTGENISAYRALSESLGYTFGALGRVAAIGAPYAGLTILAIAAYFAVLFGLIYGGLLTAVAPIYVIGILLGLAVILIFVAAYISYARDYYYGDPSPIGPTYWPSLGRMLLVMLIIIGISIPFLLAYGIVVYLALSGSLTTESSVWIVSAIIFIVWIALILFFSAKLATYVASAAVGKPQTMGQAWGSTSGATFRILLAILAFSLLFFIADFGLTQIVKLATGIDPEMTSSANFDSGYSIAVIVVTNLIRLVIYLLQIAVSAAFGTSLFRQVEA